MAKASAPLNARQVEVLRWIIDGCPDGVMAGDSYKITAVALQNRRLAVVSKKGGRWSAVATERCQQRLRQEVAGAPPTGAAQAAPAPSRQKSTPKPRRTTPRPKPPSPTDQMIAELLSNGGEIKVEQADRARYQSRVTAAIRFGKVPPGKQLVTVGDAWSTDFRVRLQDEPAWLNAPLDPIPVPTALRRPHEAVAALRTQSRPFGIDRAHVRRALLLTQALATEAERRGYTIRATKVTNDRYGYTQRESDDDFTVQVNGHGFGVRFGQQVLRTRHEPTPKELAEAERSTWYRIPKYDDTRSDRLYVELSGRFEHRQSKWKETTERPLEDSLPQILQEIELRAEAAERKRLADIAAEQERRRQWERAMEEAKLAFAENFREQTLLRQTTHWLRTSQVRDYLHAVREQISTLTDPGDIDTANEWIRWADAWLLVNDPFRQPIAPPDVPEPDEQDLKPFLKGWNPYGPHR